MSETQAHNSRQKQAQTLRWTRKIHRWTGLSLLVFFILIALSGILLGWKKNSQGYILPDTMKGQTAELNDWLSINRLSQLALAAAEDLKQPTIDRIDIRPDKGVAKFTFTDSYLEIQIDGATGQVLQSALRRSDWIEQLHDGSIVDLTFGWKAGFFKLIYTSLMGLALLTFAATGFWLWYGPKKMKKLQS